MNLNKNDISIFLARIFFSSFMITHGIPKFYRIFEEKIRFADPIGLGKELSLYLATFSELIAPALIIIGLKTRFFSVFPVITMIVAAFIVHGDDPFKKMEPALLFLVGFSIILINGPGKISLDYYLGKNK